MMDERPRATSNSGETTPTGAHTPTSTIADMDTLDWYHEKEPSSDEEILQRIAKLRTKLSENVRYLVSPFPATLKQHPAIGTLTASPFTNGKSETTITCKPDIPYVTSPAITSSKPAIITSIKAFSKPNTREDLCLFVGPANYKDSTFDMQFVGWKPSQLKDIEVDWLEIPQEHTKSGLWQHGEMYIDFSSNQREIKTKINFPSPFASAPNVVVWLSGIHPGSEDSLRIFCGAEAGRGNRHNFEVVVKTWLGSKLKNVKISWVAYSKTLKGVHSGYASTDNFRTCATPQHFNTGYIEFPAGTFTKAPKVMVGLTMAELCNEKEQNARCFVSNVTHLGMCWSTNSWGETTNFGMGMSYLAIED